MITLDMVRDANLAADKAIKDYDMRAAELKSEVARRGSSADVQRARLQMAKRDDVPLAQYGGRAAFRVANATRLALWLQCELAAERHERQKL